ncbi:MAG: lipoyl(octanoyl) transferase LipB [Polyangia bacterium]
MSEPARFDLRVLPGLTPYFEARRLQLDLVERRRSGEIGETLLLLEHPPVITLGRNADPAGVIASAGELKRCGVELHRVERGGEATYHGPGQIVGYPICDLHALKIGVAAYVHRLEEAMIRAAAKLEVEAGRRERLTGVFCERGKIGAIGVRVSRGIAFHGFAFNVDPHLDHYRLIVPCGLSETPITSIAATLGRSPSMERARKAVIRSFGEVFGQALTSSVRRVQ